MCKENKTNKNKKVKQKERKEKVSPRKTKRLALKRAVARSKHWFIASVVIGYFALTYEGGLCSYPVCFIFNFNSLSV
jgi:hypothetical protein